MSPPKPPRAQTHPDRRDDYGPKSATPPRGYPSVPELAVPHEVEEEDTSTYPIEERQRRRENKPTPHRIRKLESFKDDMLERFPKVEANVEFLVDAEKARAKRAEESRKFRRDVTLKILGGVFSGSVLVAVLHACGVL